MIHVKHVGICGSDLHFFQFGFSKKNLFPKIPCHECAGIVEELGPGVEGLNPGDLVAVEPGVPCGTCEWCKRGEYNLCSRISFLSAFLEDGCLCEYITHSANFCYRLPSPITTMQGALLEPFCVGLHAASRSGASFGKTAAITGAGCIGLSVLMALRLSGMEEIYVSDCIPFRLKKAEIFGARDAVNASQENFAEEVLRKTDGRGVDICIDTTGTEGGIFSLPSLCRPGGICTIVGNLGRTAPFDYYNFYEKELTVHSVFRYRNLYPAAIQAVFSGTVKPENMVTDIFPFNKAPEAFRHCIEDKDKTLKVILELPD